MQYGNKECGADARVLSRVSSSKLDNEQTNGEAN